MTNPFSWGNVEITAPSAGGDKDHLLSRDVVQTACLILSPYSTLSGCPGVVSCGSLVASGQFRQGKQWTKPDREFSPLHWCFSAVVSWLRGSGARKACQKIKNSARTARRSGFSGWDRHTIDQGSLALADTSGAPSGHARPAYPYFLPLPGLCFRFRALRVDSREIRMTRT